MIFRLTFFASFSSHCAVKIFKTLSHQRKINMEDSNGLLFFQKLQVIITYFQKNGFMSFERTL